MGTALINAHRYAELPPRGSRLAVDPELMIACPPGVVISDFGGPVIIDWIHTRTKMIDDIDTAAAMKLPPIEELEKRLVAYVGTTGALAESAWGRNTLSLNGCR